MFGLFKNKILEVNGTKIAIKTKKLPLTEIYEKQGVIDLKERDPELKIEIDNKEFISFKFGALTINPNLENQYFHYSIRILTNMGVMIDGLISKSKEEVDISGQDWEGIRFQPFFIGDQIEKNKEIQGGGMYAKGLCFPGNVTPSNIRYSCWCPSCNKSFNAQSYHSGFSNSIYLYSSDSKNTLMISYSELGKILGVEISELRSHLKNIEEKISSKDNPSLDFKFTNSFLCPNCGAPYVDLSNLTEDQRSQEIYVLRYLNDKVLSFNDI